MKKVIWNELAEAQLDDSIAFNGGYSSICRLSVSKNKEAFAIKDEFSNATGGRLDYTIDY